MNKMLPILLLLSALALAACDSQANEGDAPNEKSAHAHGEGGAHAPHDEQAPETEAFYGDDKQGKTTAAPSNSDSEHAHDDAHGHSH